MPYAVKEDIVELYGSDALAVLADRDGDGTIDSNAVARALDEASEEIDLYIATRHELPLSVTPPSLRRLCIEIATYRLAGSDGGVRTDDQRQRYEDAIDLLKRIANGTAKLTLPVDDSLEDDDPTRGQGPAPAILEGSDRLFTRGKLRDI